MKKAISIASISLVAFVGICLAQADMKAKITSEPRLAKRFEMARRKPGEVAAGDTYDLAFKLNAATAEPRAWPLRVSAAIYLEDKTGARRWDTRPEVTGLRGEGDQELNASVVTGDMTIKATFKNVTDKIIAWRLRVSGRMVLDPSKPNGFVEQHLLAIRDWTAPGVKNLRDEPFRSMDDHSDQIKKLAAKVAVGK